LRVDHYFHLDGLSDEFQKLRIILLRIERLIMATQTELANQLLTVRDQLTKASAEIQSRVATLEEAIANAGNSTPEVDAALDGVKQIAQALDELNPDAPTP
jgi:hypothetical protein